MKISYRIKMAMLLLVICVIIHVYSNDPDRVEENYSNGFFMHLSGFLRKLTGPIPFSVGDLLYGLAAAWIIWKIIRLLVAKKKGTPYSSIVAARSVKLLIVCSIIYIVFNIFWGVNYNRKGIATQLGLVLNKYTSKELGVVNCLLIDKINLSKQVLVQQKQTYPDNRQLYNRVAEAYALLVKQYPYLAYSPASIKPSLWGWLGNYAGFTGYYNPFTGEAQINSTIPRFLQPFVACHEVGHQIGYAKEQEANFVGYLAASNSRDTLFHYSVYLELFAYANRNLYRTDSSQAKLYFKELSPAVINDLEEWRRFNRRHKNKAEPVIRWMYGKFLQGNRQPEGILAYDQVTAFLIAYYKKFGKI